MASVLQRLRVYAIYRVFRAQGTLGVGPSDAGHTSDTLEPTDTGSSGCGSSSKSPWPAQPHRVTRTRTLMAPKRKGRVVHEQPPPRTPGTVSGKRPTEASLQREREYKDWLIALPVPVNRERG